MKKTIAMMMLLGGGLFAAPRIALVRENVRVYERDHDRHTDHFRDRDVHFDRDHDRGRR